MKHSRSVFRRLSFVVFACLCFGATKISKTYAQELNPNPPQETVKLIFIHHSTGENWLSDTDGGLGVALDANNYFVSDTNYGWGPDSIGDNTDYHNWIEWFVGPNHSRYLDALYQENGVHSPYSRTLEDPGGENQIIVFKSCFPNSDLAGSPSDPASDSEWFTVGHAKYVYNQLLSYFATRPDKMFVALTPPPLIDSTHAENARAFSRWLVEDWLEENGYATNNVFVWDFHNVLTDPNNHHRTINGSVEYVINNGNGALYYDSAGDDHPNREGNQKSTGEFVPMLNVFYHQWSQNIPAQIIDSEPEPETPDTNEMPEDSITTQDQEVIMPSVSGLIDDFEAGIPPGTNGWEAFWDESTESSLSCGIDTEFASSGNGSLRINFDVAPGGWATCPILFDSPQNFQDAVGISFDYKASSPEVIFNFDAFGGTPENRSTYHFTVEAGQDSVNNWVHYELNWDQILRVDWEENPGSPINPNEINGFAFGFSTYTDTPNAGILWIDNFALVEEGQSSVADAPDSSMEIADETPTEPGEPLQEETAGEDQPATEETPGRSFCPGSTTLIAISVFTAISLGGGKRLQKKE